MSDDAAAEAFIRKATVVRDAFIRAAQKERMSESEQLRAICAMLSVLFSKMDDETYKANKAVFLDMVDICRGYASIETRLQ